jgi:excisionase family DNA binding protein
VSTTSQDQSERELAIKRMRIKRNAHARVLRRKERRAEAVRSERALYVSVAEFAELTGVHPATVRRRIADGTLKAKKLVGKDNAFGRILILRDQLG